MAAPIYGAGTAFAVPQTTIGLAKETTRGVAEAPTAWVPVKGPKYKPDLTMIPDDTIQGSMVAVYNLVPGQRYDSHGWDAYPYLDTFPLFLQAELGSPDTFSAAGSATTLAAAAAAGSSTISATASVAANSWITLGSGGTVETHYTTAVTGSGPYTVTLQTALIYPQPSGAAVTPLNKHVFSLLNNAAAGDQPPTYTISDFDGDVWRQLSGGQIDELTIKGNNSGLVDYTCTWFANPATTPTAPSPSYSSVPAVPGWTSAILIGGTQLTQVEDWELDLKRGVKPIPALTGNQEYYTYFAGPIEATGKFTFVEQANSPFLADFLAGTKQSLDITTFDIADGAALNLHSSVMMYKTGDLDRSKEWVEVMVDFQLLPSAGDATAGGVSPLRATVANSAGAAY